MKQIILVLILLLTFPINGMEVEYHQTFYKDGKLKSETRYHNSVMEGDKVELYSNGKLKSSSYYRRGILIYETFFGKDGKETKSVEYSDGIAEVELANGEKYFEKNGKKLSPKEQLKNIKRKRQHKNLLACSKNLKTIMRMVYAYRVTENRNLHYPKGDFLKTFIKKEKNKKIFVCPEHKEEHGVDKTGITYEVNLDFDGKTRNPSIIPMIWDSKSVHNKDGIKGRNVIFLNCYTEFLNVKEFWELIEKNCPSYLAKHKAEAEAAKKIKIKKKGSPNKNIKINELIVYDMVRMLLSEQNENKIHKEEYVKSIKELKKISSSDAHQLDKNNCLSGYKFYFKIENNNCYIVGVPLKPNVTGELTIIGSTRDQGISWKKYTKDHLDIASFKLLDLKKWNDGGDFKKSTTKGISYEPMYYDIEVTEMWTIFVLNELMASQSSFRLESPRYAKNFKELQQFIYLYDSIRILNAFEKEVDNPKVLHGYYYKFLETDSGKKYAFIAYPKYYGRSGKYIFYCDASNTIYKIDSKGLEKKLIKVSDIGLEFKLIKLVRFTRF